MRIGWFALQLISLCSVSAVHSCHDDLTISLCLFPLWVHRVLPEIKARQEKQDPRVWMYVSACIFWSSSVQEQSPALLGQNVMHCHTLSCSCWCFHKAEPRQCVFFHFLLSLLQGSMGESGANGRTGGPGPAVR